MRWSSLFYLLYKHKNWLCEEDKKRKLIKFLTQHSDLIWIPKLVKQFAKIRPWNHMKDVCVAPEAWGGCMSKIKLITLIKVFWIFFTCVHTYTRTYAHKHVLCGIWTSFITFYHRLFADIVKEKHFERLSFLWGGNFGVFSPYILSPGTHTHKKQWWVLLQLESDHKKYVFVIHYWY